MIHVSLFRAACGQADRVRRFQTISQTSDEIVSDHLKHTKVIEAAALPPTVIADLDDDHMIACAIGGKAACIVTGDPHLLRLGRYENIPILAVNAFLEQLRFES